MVKGWAVERAARRLTALDDTDFCLSAGGDLVCRVADPARPAWQIGIEHPHDPHRLIATVPVRDGAVATSGTVHRGSHLVDARTGRPAVGAASVTVIGSSLTWADIDATAAFALGAEAPPTGCHPARPGWPGRLDRRVHDDVPRDREGAVAPAPGPHRLRAAAPPADQSGAR